jgi:YVTN family beta-propeller protein
VISTATNTVVASIPVGDDFLAHIDWTFFEHWRGSDPVHVAITPDGTRAYVTNFGSHNVSVICTAANAVIATVKVGHNPLDIALTPDSASAYVVNADSNSVSVIDTNTNAVSATVPVGVHPVNVAIF